MPSSFAPFVKLYSTKHPGIEINLFHFSVYQDCANFMFMLEIKNSSNLIVKDAKNLVLAEG